nr:single-stranded DNA-binding protein [Ardenticatenales bacterium]
LQTRSWEDGSGQRNYRIELVAEQMTLLERGSPQEEPRPSAYDDEEA